MEKEKPKEIKKINDTTWEISKDYKKGMRVPARIIATKEILDAMDPGVFDQVTNLAFLPGVQKYTLCHADGHWGYGAPIGGVAAFDMEEGIISPGLVGFDINCGMRVLRTNLSIKEVQPKIKELINTLFKLVPAGVGCKGFVKLDDSKFNNIMENGAQWCIKNGYGWNNDLERIEDYGRLEGADHTKISQKAKSRGINQLGTLGSGNHYLEIQIAKAENIFDKKTAKQMGIVEENQILIMLHCGSRGFGHQIGTDYMKSFDRTMKEHNINIPDKELSCAPFQSKEGQNYYSAMKCAGNMAYANRQVILHQIREGFKTVFKEDPEKLEMELIYDCTHNIAREHKITVDGKKKKVLVHLKGSTTSVGPGYPRLTKPYQDLGSPIIVGGSMETGSYLLKGTKKAEEETFGTTLHGSGRTMSRSKAKQLVRGDKLQKDMEKRGIYVKGVSMSGLAEESGQSYKDIERVVDAVVKAGISERIIRLIPIGNLKGSFNLFPNLTMFLILLILVLFVSRI